MARGRRGDIRVARRGTTASGGGPEARRSPAKARRFWLAAMAGVVVVVAGLAGTTEVRRRVYTSRLPALPDLSAQPASIGGHLREADRSARANPLSAEAVAALCLAYHADLFYDQADRCYLAAEDVSPQDWRWTYYRALVQNARGNGDAVVAGMRRVVGEAPEFGPAWLRLGEAEFKAGHYDRAEEAWTRAGSTNEPEHEATAGSPAHVPGARISTYAALGLARIALLRGEPDRARQILEPAVSSAPKFGPAFRVLGASYEALGRSADAGRALHLANRLRAYASYADPLVDALVRESRSSTFLLQQAAEANDFGNVAWDEYVTRRALEFDAGNADAAYRLGGILRGLARHAEALEVYRRYHQLVPDDFQGLGQIGSCLTDLGQFAEAEPLLRQAATGLDDATSHYNLGLLLARLGRLQEAVIEYERALDRDSQDANTRSNLAAVLVRQGKLDAATRQLASALEIDPDNASAHTNLGAVLAQEGHFEQAARQFRDAMRLDPGQIQARTGLQAIGPGAK
jgi:tetratricopeptide (TPR) repeat protein